MTHETPGRLGTTLTMKTPRTARSVMEYLRIGVGLVWVANLVFILDPANHYWSTFSAVALTFAPTTIGGPGFAQFVSAHPLFFSWLVALVTGYLALAFTLGFTTRIACFVGSGFSAILLATQWGSTFFFPGGTDIGEHPLYILIYGTLVVGGAGASLSVDSYLRDAWEVWSARRRVAPASAPRRAPFGHTWTAPIPAQTIFVYFVAGTMFALAVGFGLVLAVPAAPSGGGTPPLAPAAYVNLTIDVNNTTGMPYYTPANFTVGAGLVEFTIVDHDAPANWSECPCHVGGTVGGVEYVNGTPVGVVSGVNVAHTFNIPILGLQVLSPGQSTVQFYLEVDHPGVYTWYCLAPCGTGTDPYNSPPMGVPGMMTGTLTVS